MSDKIKRRAHEAMTFIRRTNLPELLAYSLSAALLVIGLGLLLAPAQHQVDTFNPAWGFASPVAWAVVMFGTSILCMAMVWAQRSWAFVPFMAQTTVWSAWAAFTVISLPDGGIPSSGVIYTFAAWASLMVTVVYWGELEERTKRSGRGVPWGATK